MSYFYEGLTSQVDKSSSKPQLSPFGGDMHILREDHDFQAKFESLARKVEALE